MTCNSRCSSSPACSSSSRISTYRNNTARQTRSLTRCSNLSSMMVRRNNPQTRYRFIIPKLAVKQHWHAQRPLWISINSFSISFTARVIQEYGHLWIQLADSLWKSSQVSLLAIAEYSHVISKYPRRSHVHDGELLAQRCPWQWPLKSFGQLIETSTADSLVAAVVLLEPEPELSQ